MKAGVELDTWIGSCRVRVFPWVDGKHIYVNVQYFSPGQSIERPPAWEKSVLITNNKAGRELVFGYTHTLVAHIERRITADGLRSSETPYQVQNNFLKFLD